MQSVIEVVGHNAASGSIRSRLRKRDASWHPLAIVADWPDVGTLHHFSNQARTPWLLIEDAGDGAVAIGPLFRPDHRGCFACYIGRRRANGGDECRPAAAVSDRVLDVIEQELASLSAFRSRLSREQAVVSTGGATRRHPFLPVPDCPTCVTGQLRQPAIEPMLTWSDLVGDRLGLVHEVQYVADLAEPMAAAVAWGARTDAFWINRAPNRGMAVDDDPERARRRAVSESIERYCAAAIPSDLLMARPVDLDAPYIAPSRLGTFYSQWSEGQSVLRWVLARSLRGDHQIWVPASAVYVPYPSDDNEAVVYPQCSIGLAAHTSQGDAVRHGLYEVVERDESLRAWRFGLPVQSVSSCPVDLEGLRLVRVPCEAGLQVVISFIERMDIPFTSTGLAARPTLGEAARHAVFEAVLSRLWLREWLATNGHQGAYNPVRTMVDNAVAHAVRKDLRVTRQRWLNAHAARCEATTPSWASIVDKFPDTCFVDLTTPDVAAAGLRVVRVLVPDKVLSDDDSLHPRLGGDPTPHPFG